MNLEQSIRILTAANVGQFNALRLEALRESPEAFSSSYEDNLAVSDAEFLGRLGDLPDAVFGAWHESTLIAMAGFKVEAGLKTRHKGFMWGVYVAPDWRGRAVGTDLVSRVLDHACDHVEILRSGVVTNGQGANRLYHRLGFNTYGIERHALKIGKAYFDEELIEICF